MSFIKKNLNWFIFIIIIILLVIAKVSIIVDDQKNKINIKVVKESFEVDNGLTKKINTIDKKLSEIEFKMSSMKDPVEDDIEYEKEKKDYITSTDHYN